MRHLITALVLAALPFLAGAEDITITVRNSLTVRPVVEQAAKVFKASHAGVGFSMTEGVTTACIKGVMDGSVQMATAVRALKADEKAACPELIDLAIGMDALVLVVNEANPVTGLTKKQVVDLFTGATANWKDVGGADAAVVLVARNESFTTLELFESSFGLEHQVAGEGAGKGMTFKTKGAAAAGTAKALMIGTNMDAVTRCITNPHAVTFASLGNCLSIKAKGAKIKLLALDGIEATAATVTGKTYPICRTLYLVTKGAPQGMLKEFVDFLVSAEGQKLVAEKDFIPMVK